MHQVLEDVRDAKRFWRLYGKSAVKNPTPEAKRS
jgi:hypothetical protein